MYEAILIAGFNYEGTGMDLPDCILDAEKKREMFGSVLPGVELIFQTDRGNREYRNDLIDVVQRARDEHPVLIFDSGHGTRTRGKSEEDGWHEAIVTMQKPGDDSNVITDVDLNNIFSIAQGPVFYLADRCYAGGFFSAAMYARDILYKNMRPRFFPIDRPESQERVFFKERIGQGITKGLQHSPCLETEVSWSTGKGGAFSNAWNEVWKPGMTWLEIQKAICPAYIPTASFNQTPMLIGTEELRERPALI